MDLLPFKGVSHHEPGYCEWKAYPVHREPGKRPWLEYRNGTISTHRTDDHVLRKLCAITDSLGTVVQGEGGEIIEEEELS